MFLASETRTQRPRIYLLPLTMGWLLTACISLGWASDETMQPRNAWTQQDQVAVRSGPSTAFYATEYLPAGSRVEVYRQVDGWLAIRPTAASFSWVPAASIEITDNPSLGRVINTPVKTRVGSTLELVHDVEYISLHDGEVIELLGSQMLPGADQGPAERWFKISPPPGEFRWVQASDVQFARRVAQPASSPAPRTETDETSETQAAHSIDVTDQLSQPVETAAATRDRSNQADMQVAEIAPRDAANDSETPGSNLVPVDIVGSGLATADQPSMELVSLPPDTAPKATPMESRPPQTGWSSRDAQPIASTSHQTKQQPASNVHVNPVTWQAVPEPTDVLTAPEPRSFRDRLNALNVMLSRAILDDINHWRLSSVREQAETLKDQATTAGEYEATKKLLAKLADFEQLKQRNDDDDQRPTTDSPVLNAEQIAVGDRARSANRSQQTGRAPFRVVSFEQDTGGASESNRQATEPDDRPRAPEMPRIVRSAPMPPVNVAPQPLRRQQSPDNSMFDGTGTLILVQSRRSDMPRYALADRAGRIVKFVSLPPNHGKSIRHLINQPVGVVGEAGFLRKYNKPLLMARRIVKLKR